MLSPFEESVPPLKYGGIELVIYNLTEQLVKMGHEVTLLATGDSKTSAKLMAVFPDSLRINKDIRESSIRSATEFIGIKKAMEYLNRNDFDIVHNHIGWMVLLFDNLLKFPIVTTLHGPLNISSQQIIYREYKNSNYVSISLSQRKPMLDINFIANVYNGIEIKKFNQGYTPKDYFAFLGRMSPEKGPIQAIEIAKRAGVKLIMGAKVDVVDGKYFVEKVEPLIDGKQIQFIGEVNHIEKVKLLKNAKALIAPIQWEEPFGLVFIEAMACGTPVISMKRGSVPEIILDKETGFICNNIDEAVRNIGNIGNIDRKKCYEHVRDNFSAEKMVENYIKVYEKILDS